MKQNALTVSQVNEYIRTVLDRDDVLSSMAVKGEVSNYKLYPSGHHYFSLKDDSGCLKCVMFRGNAMSLRFRPQNGMKVIAFGKIAVYPRDGVYQLYCSALIDAGTGDLYAAFEQLKQKLQAEGLFDQAHKKPIPKYPGVIGIVTSSAGAAIHDMLRILGKRFPLSRVRLFPVRVQGVEAPGEIVQAIRFANLHALADVLIVGRGGGSIEDLWAFNDERVAYAIYESRIPVISAVGHEPDVTISDYVADQRAATPSNAAELAVPDRQALYQQLDASMESMTSQLSQKLRSARQRLSVLAGSAALKSPESYLSIRAKDLRHLRSRLVSAQMQKISGLEGVYGQQAGKLDAMSPLKVITRGYSVVRNDDGKVIRSVHETGIGQNLTITLSDGAVKTQVIGKENNP